MNGLKILHIEPTTSCNLRCFHCAIRRPSYRHVMMDWQTFAPLLDVALNHRPQVMLNGHGECLTHPDYPRMFEAMAATGCDIEFQTNGTLLSKELCRRFLVTRQWARLTVSIDGVGQKYEDIRGTSWQSTLANLREFCHLRGNASTPHMALEFVAMRRNLQQLPKVAEVAVELRAGTLLVSDLVEYEHSLGQALSNDDLTSVRTHCHEARKILAEAEIGMEVSDSVSQIMGWDNGRFARIRPADGVGVPCCVPWMAAYVRASGDVFPCCRLSECMDPVGNVKQQSLEAIWDGRAWTAFRADMMVGNFAAACNQCTRAERQK